MKGLENLHKLRHGATEADQVLDFLEYGLKRFTVHPLLLVRLGLLGRERRFLVVTAQRCSKSEQPGVHRRRIWCAATTLTLRLIRRRTVDVFAVGRALIDLGSLDDLVKRRLRHDARASALHEDLGVDHVAFMDHDRDVDIVLHAAQ